MAFPELDSTVTWFSSQASKAQRTDQENVEKNKTFELRNVIFDLDPDDLGKREIKALVLGTCPVVTCWSARGDQNLLWVRWKLLSEQRCVGFSCNQFELAEAISSQWPLAERLLCLKFGPRVSLIRSYETQVSIRRNPFTKGGMRHCCWLAIWDMDMGYVGVACPRLWDARYEYLGESKSCSVAQASFCEQPSNLRFSIQAPTTNGG